MASKPILSCSACGERWPCTVTKRTDIAGLERAKHTLHWRKTIAGACAIIRALGCTVTYSRDWKEFRVNLPKAEGDTPASREATCFHTQDMNDAVDTAVWMIENLRRINATRG